jgi:hypothetical protein
MTPTVSWTDVANESGYVVRIYSEGSCSGTPIHTSAQLAVNATSYQVPTLLNRQTYSWQVQAKGNGTTYCDSDWSGCCSFSISAPCTNLSTPTLTAPVCGSTVNTTTPTLSWTDVANEGGYAVRIFSGGSCSGTPIHTSPQLAANTTSYDVPAGVLQAGLYSWQVQAKGNGTTYCDGNWSGCCSFAAQQAQFNYTTNNGTITITKYIGSGGAVTIPNTIDGLPVSSIGSYAFAWCYSLSSITIPTSVTSIGDWAFRDCTSLAGITIPSSVTNIGADAFNGSDLTHVTIAYGVSSIGSYAFNSCDNLTSVAIPTSVTSIERGAFQGCTSLASITIPTSVTNIGASAFNGSGLTSLPILTSVTSIAASTFSSCGNLTSVIIPTSITSIGDYAFAWCYSLSSINIPTSVASIGSHAFDGSGLTSVTIAYGVTRIWDDTFYGCTHLTSVAIPTSVTSIGSYAFDDCTTLSNITIPTSVTNIGSYAFNGCDTLTSVAIPTSVTSIESGAFQGCTSLASITIPTSITSIGYDAFSTCASLKNVTIPSSVTNIGSYAFSWCTSLTGAYFRGNAPSVGSDVFNGADNVTVYYLPGTTGWGTTFAGRSTALYAVLSSPIANSPSCGSSVSAVTPTLSWTDLANESGYVVRIYSGGSCSGTPIHTSAQLVANATSYVVPAGVLTAGQTYSWQVQAKGNGTTYCDSDWSDCCSFSISTPLSTPTPTAPVCGSTVSTITPTLNWTDETNESGYVVQIYSGGSCSGTPIHASSQLAANMTSYRVPTGVLQAGQTYSWQVQAKGDGAMYCDGNWSGCCSFTAVLVVDVTKPTLVITVPTANQRWSNAVFTVKGTANDNVQVDSVLYQLNGGAWSNALTTNAWTNWTAGVVLAPGTNSVRAYAMDTTGNKSLTNTANLQFVVTNRLLVSATGKGTLSPNYSNSWLEIGRNYSMKATAGSGFVFTNWVASTNWAGSATTNNATVQFMMQSNLTLQVNFADVTKPTITITSPTAGQKMTNALANVKGTALDNWGVGSVQYQLNGGAWGLATSTNGWTNWTAVLPLTAGTNIIRAYAVDLGGNASTTNTVSVVSSNTFNLRLAFGSAQPMAGNGLLLSLEVSPGLSARIQTSTNLEDWTTLTSFVSTNATMQFRDSAATNYHWRFYRAVAP